MIYFGNRKQHRIITFSSDPTAQYLFLQHGAQSESLGLSVSLLRRQYQCFYKNLIDEQKKNVRAILRLLLIDSANAFASSHVYNSRSADRTTRLGMAYPRDLSRCICISYLSAPFNLPDQGAKYPHGRTLVGNANCFNAIAIGFLSRKDLKSMLHLLPTTIQKPLRKKGK